MGRGKKQKSMRELSFKERCCFGLAVGAGGIGNILLGSFIAYYYTDVAGLSTAVAGLIASICTIFDGFSDFGMGILIDRTRTKWGKARPWILVGGVLDGLLLLLTFSVPGFSNMTMRIIYSFVTCFLLKVIFGTMLGVSGSTLITLITGKEKERNSLGMYNVVFNVVLALGVSALTLPLTAALGGGQGAWSIVIGIYGVVIAGASIAAFFGVKERTVVTSGEENQKAFPVKKLLEAVMRNKYFWLMLLAMTLYNMFSATGTINVYYFTRVLNNPGAYSISSLGSLIFLFFMPLYLKVTNKLGVRKAIFYSCILTAVIAMSRIIAPTNTTYYILAGWLSAIALGPFSVCYMSLTGEIADWGEWKTGIPTQAIVCSLISVAGKIAAGLGTAAVTFVLTKTGYDGLAAVQPESAIAALKILGTVAGGIGFILMAVCFIFIRIDKDQEQMHKDLDEKRGVVAQVESVDE